MADNLYKVAAKFMKENPKLKYYEAMIEAKKIKKKELSDGNPERFKIIKYSY